MVIDSLEFEKKNFLEAACSFIESVKPIINKQGRPQTDQRIILKHLLVMSYNAMSYRRAISDIKLLYDNGYIEKVLSRTTINDYANKKSTNKILKQLISISALFNEGKTILMDSTWFSKKMYTGGNKLVHQKKGLQGTRKLHVACFKETKAICFAKATCGTVPDCPVFEEMINKTKKFDTQIILADKAYSSKKNYSLCQEKGIIAYLDFKKTHKNKRGQSKLYKEQLSLWKNNPETWKETYRYRVLVEGLFSTIKKKFNNYLRAKNENSQNTELLLKCLVHNLTLIK